MPTFVVDNFLIKPVKMPLWTIGMCKRCSEENMELADGYCLFCWDKIIDNQGEEK
jgi:hypothetical protein